MTVKPMICAAAASSSSAAEHVREATGHLRSEQQRLQKSLTEESGRIGGRQAEVAGKASEDGVRLGQRMIVRGGLGPERARPFRDVQRSLPALIASAARDESRSHASARAGPAAMGSV